MDSHVTVIFDNDRTVDLFVEVVASEQAASDALDWFEAAWDTLGCEFPSSKSEIALRDKVLGVAGALGYDTLVSDEKERQEFARHTALALNQPRVIVDVPRAFVGY